MTVALRRSWAKDLDAATLYELLKLRVEVFVVEQATPYPELDGRDLCAETRHFWLEGPDGEVICTLRLMEEHPGGAEGLPHRPGLHQTHRARPRPRQPAAAGRAGRGGRLPVPHQRTDLPGGDVQPARLRPRRRRVPRRRHPACADGAKPDRTPKPSSRDSGLSVQRDRRPRPAAAGAGAVRGAARDRRRADPRREGHGEVDRGARPGACAWPRSDGDSALVELPIGATEDRVVGSLDLQKVLRDGEHAFSPGLLARAHGGVLYVDEVNLLHDHLVDVLLDAAAMGRVHVERDGVSHSHEARFVLIGTMNPEEGELRPQLLDRFGLTVDVHASRDVDVRAEVIRQRMAFEADPGRVRRLATPRQDAELARRIAAARASVGDVVLPDNELRRIAALCAAFDVDGMRADLVVARTAVAHAAWRGADDGQRRGHPGGRRAGAAAPAPARPVRRSGAGPRPARRGDGAGAGNPPTSPSPTRSPTRRWRRHRRRTRISSAPQRNSGVATPDRARRRRRCSGPGRWSCPASGRARRAGGRGRATAPERPSRRPTDPDAGHGVHVFATLLAAAGRQQPPGPAAAGTRRRPPRDPGRPRRQSGDLRRRRVRVDGRA